MGWIFRGSAAFYRDGAPYPDTPCVLYMPTWSVWDTVGRWPDSPGELPVALRPCPDVRTSFGAPRLPSVRAGLAVEALGSPCRAEGARHGGWGSLGAGRELHG